MIILSEINPYDSREAILEDDGRTVYLYLVPSNPSAPGEQMLAVWVANRVPAPESDDRAAMQAGTAPRMPREGTRHPGGHRPFLAEDLELAWFEEGDGVALLERGVPLAVIPAWSGKNGFRGYAREAISQTKLAWELEEALETLGPRIETAQHYWEWRSEEGSWSEILESGIAHLEARLGMHHRYWAADSGKYPPRAVLLFQPDSHPGVSVCATVGMGAQPMPQVEMAMEDPTPYRRVELALGTTADPIPYVRLLSALMGLPWSDITWLGSGHMYSRAPSSAFLPGAAAILQRDPPPDRTPPPFGRPQPAPDLSGHVDRSGDPITYLWVVSISPAEQQLAQEQGSPAVVQKLQNEKRGWIWR